MPPKHPLGAKRGAPYGNTNALTHGYYSRCRTADLNRIRQIISTHPTAKIEMHRLLLNRLIDLSGDIQDTHQAMILLRTLSVVASSLSRLIQTQDSVTPFASPLGRSLQQALKEVQEEFGLNPPAQGSTPASPHPSPQRS